MTSRTDAVTIALRFTTWPHAMCAAFVQRVYSMGWVGASAIDAWNRAHHKHTDFPPPPGVPCYWAPKGSNPYGHIAVSLGGGKCRSSDYPGRGQVGTVDIRWIEQHWPNTGRYLGWSEDIAGSTIPGGSAAATGKRPAAPPRPRHLEDDMPALLIKGDKAPNVYSLDTVTGKRRPVEAPEFAARQAHGEQVKTLPQATFDAIPKT